jgi:EAL domain-containing protein (putative c-di-GMP-specific phosphodiesterase class I)
MTHKTQTLLQKFKKGDLIFQSGDAGDCAYIIDSGRVEIFSTTSGIELPLNNLGVGEIFGEMAILDRNPRSASARALDDVLVSVVSRHQFEQRIDQADPIVRLLVSILVKRLRKNALSSDSLLLTDPPGNREVGPEKITMDHSQTQVIEKIKFEAELYEALKNDSFILHYQPIISIKTNKIAGFESLIRWQSDTRGMVRPDLFMNVAEETSLIVPIGKWVFEKSCETLHKFQHKLRAEKKAHHDFFITVNISGKQFADPQFFNMLETVPKQFSVNQKNVKLEITEKILLEGNIFFFWIEKCRAQGFPVSLDDFGTGYSMLSYLSDFNVDNIKIDQSFVRKIEQDHRTRIVVQAIINIAKGLGIEVIAEGVETEKQARLLRDLGCDYLQGFYYSRPIPFDEAWQYLLTHI